MITVHRRVALLARPCLSFALLFTACGQTPAPQPAPANPSSRETYPQQQPQTPDPADGTAGMRGGTDKLATVGPAGTGAVGIFGSIQCGNTSCNAATHTCCTWGLNSGQCIDRLDMPEGSFDLEFQTPLYESCEQRSGATTALTGIFLCDDSADCAKGQVCCEQSLGGGVALNVCLSNSQTGQAVCDYHERCTGETCRTTGTHCVKNECRLANVSLKCAGKRCTSSAPFCCQRKQGVPPTCESNCEEVDTNDHAWEFECATSRDCPPGALCQGKLFGSYCGTLLDVANAMILCESNADCPRDACVGVRDDTPPNCVHSQYSWFKGCSCE